MTDHGISHARGKQFLYDEGLHVPLVIAGPGVDADRTRTDLVEHIDIAALSLGLAGIPIPDYMQGRSFKSICTTGDEPEDWKKEAYYRYWMHMAHHDNPAHYGIRTREYKLIFFYGLPLDAPGARPRATPAYWELYDLKKDPREMNNIYGDPEYAEVVKKMRAALPKGAKPLSPVVRVKKDKKKK